MDDRPASGCRLVVPHVCGRVHVQSDEIERRGDDLHFLFSKRRSIDAFGLKVCWVILSLEDWHEILSGQFTLSVARGGDVLIAFQNGYDSRNVLGQSQANGRG